MTGFGNEDESKISAVFRRLEPSAKRGDIEALADGLRKMAERYGHDISEQALRQIIKKYPSITGDMIDCIPASVKPEVMAAANEVMASVLEKAGLRLEEHMRVSELGVALSKEAIAIFASTGFPQVELLGEGNETLDGVGLNRVGGFIHPLSEVFDKGDLPEKTLNMWMAASVFISAAMGWMEGDKESCLDVIKNAVFIAAPTADLDTLLGRSRYDDRVLLKLCQLVHDGLDKKARASIEREGDGR